MEDWVIATIVVIGLPVVLGIAADVFKRWANLKEKQLDHATALASDKAAAQASHIERLEQRVRVLERIATDKGAELAAQIEDLRGEARAN